MKKRILLAVFAILVLLLAVGCGKSENQQATDAASTSDTSVISGAAPGGDEGDANASDVLFGTDGGMIVFTVIRSYALESDAWLGVIPTGTIYKNEADADEVDLIYTYCENLDSEDADSYRFPFEKDSFDGLEDGTYDLVLCSSDNGEIGKVLFQIGLEKSGDKIVLDAKNEK